MGLKQIKGRIKTAKNIAKITQAMEMVAASKMRRAQERTLSSRPYALKLDQILQNLQGRVDPDVHKLLKVQGQGKIAIILISTDRGLCGPYNHNLFRFLDTQMLGPDLTFVTVGRKGSHFLLKSKRNLEADFPGFPDHFIYEDTLAISQIALNGFLQGKFNQVWVAYMRFVNTLSQTPTLTKILPISDLFSSPQTSEKPSPSLYLFEPSTHSILDWLLPYYVELKIFQSILDALASEHSARMVTMKNAHDSATDIVSDLSLDYNRARQTKITTELLDVITARAALGE